MESINGIPAHPLFVHAPVVLVPLSALFALLLAAWPKMRRKASWALALSAVVALVATQIAIVSGFRFDELLDGAVNTNRHADLAETSRNLVGLFVLVATALAFIDRRNGSESSTRSENLARGTAVLAGLLSVAATVWLVRAGEEGARLVWSGIVQ